MGRGQRRRTRRKSAQRATERRTYAANTALLEVVVERLGGRGDGLAEAEMKIGYGSETRPLFIPFALPGERVRVRPVSDRGAGVVCDLVELVQPAPERVEAACEHFMVCGSCAVQHLGSGTYQTWKREQVVQALARAGLGDVTVGALRTWTPGTRRRADFVLRKTGSRLIAGFHERGSNRIVEVAECPILRPPILAVMQPLRFLFDGALEPGQSVNCVVNELDNGLDMLLCLPDHPDVDFRERLAAFADEQDVARLSYHAVGDTIPDPVPLAQRRTPAITFGTVSVTPPPGAFLQATADGEAAIQQLVRDGTEGARSVLDLYAGCGTLCLALDDSVDRLAVEGDDGLLAALRAGADAARLGDRVRTERRDLAQRPFIGKELGTFDAVVLDPPRAGAREQAAALAASMVQRIVYVSCNPATFARDARTLVEGGYDCLEITPIDQFLWTPHIELVAHFVRRGA